MGLGRRGRRLGRALSAYASIRRMGLEFTLDRMGKGRMRLSHGKRCAQLTVERATAKLSVLIEDGLMMSPWQPTVTDDCRCAPVDIFRLSLQRLLDLIERLSRGRIYTSALLVHPAVVSALWWRRPDGRRPARAPSQLATGRWATWLRRSLTSTRLRHFFARSRPGLPGPTQEGHVWYLARSKLVTCQRSHRKPRHRSPGGAPPGRPASSGELERVGRRLAAPTKLLPDTCPGIECRRHGRRLRRLEPQDPLERHHQAARDSRCDGLDWRGSAAAPTT
jgi:hypothetical protein